MGKYGKFLGWTLVYVGMVLCLIADPANRVVTMALSFILGWDAKSLLYAYWRYRNAQKEGN